MKNVKLKQHQRQTAILVKTLLNIASIPWFEFDLFLLSFHILIVLSLKWFISRTSLKVVIKPLFSVFLHQWYASNVVQCCFSKTGLHYKSSIDGRGSFGVYPYHALS